MNPIEYVQNFRDLGRPAVLPIHHKVFQLADNGYEHPLEMLQSAINREEEAYGKFFPLMVGESSFIP